MELFIICVALFVVGVVGAMLYEKFKDTKYAEWFFVALVIAQGIYQLNYGMTEIDSPSEGSWIDFYTVTGNLFWVYVVGKFIYYRFSWTEKSN